MIIASGANQSKIRYDGKACVAGGWDSSMSQWGGAVYEVRCEPGRGEIRVNRVK